MTQAIINVRIGQDQYSVSGADFQYMLMVVKAIPGRQWIADEKIWNIPEAKRTLALRRLAEGYAKVFSGPGRTMAMRSPLTVTPR